MSQLPLFGKKEIGGGPARSFRPRDNAGADTFETPPTEKSDKSEEITIPEVEEFKASATKTHAEIPPEAEEKPKIKRPNPTTGEGPSEKTPSSDKNLSGTPRKMQKASSPMQAVYENILRNLRDYFQKSNVQRTVVGLSGGIDSSLTLKLAVDSLGPEKVFGVIMPEVGLTQRDNIDHAKQLAAFLGVKTFYQPINTLIIDFKLVPWEPTEHALMNTKARIRSVLLYSIANTLNALVLGTSNKSEILLGYGTKYGDLAADVEVIGELYKTEVYELARHLGFSDVLLNKPPSAELKPNHTDEEELGATYAELDVVLKKIVLEEKTVEELIDRGLSPTLVHKVARLIATNQHKREMPPVIRTSQT